jgi:6,7-dimethyl-8-ribityllumazine synthase
MNMAEPLRAHVAAPLLAGGRILVVEARYYESVGAMLFDGCRAAIAAAGAAMETIGVPGALEIPAAIAIAVDAARATGRPYDAAVALGCVVRGETFHFEIVAGESARALMDLSVAGRLALGNGILTVDSLEQAEERADPKAGDKGGDAARAALRLAALKRELSSS